MVYSIHSVFVCRFWRRSDPGWVVSDSISSSSFLSLSLSLSLSSFLLSSLSSHSFPPFPTLFSFLLSFFLSNLPLFFSPSLSSLFSFLLARYEQTQELLEKRKVFLLKIVASAYLPPPTPGQAPSSTKSVSNDGCTERGRSKLTRKNV